eukprot:scaffold38548_cov53-Phaeocystis_antarctica.AAC.5
MARHTLLTAVPDTHSLHGICPTVARIGARNALGFHHRSIGQLRSPLVVRGRLPELRCRARPRLPSPTISVQHLSPHGDCDLLVRRRPRNLRRQRLEPPVVPPLRLGHLGAIFQP